MTSTLNRLSDLIIRAPMPVGIATISAAIITRHAIPASSRSPVIMFCNDRGNKIVVRICVLDAPSVCDASRYSVSTLLIPVIVL